MPELPEDIIDDSRPLGDTDTFSFSCGPERSCFTTCCYDLSLVLMPYDILRLSRHLGMKTGDFLKRYTTVHVGAESGFPVIQLNMEEGSLKCPFLHSEKGCSVYEDRPGACRTYPLARIARRSRDRDGVEETYYAIRDPDCEGFKEGRIWTVEEWKKNEGIVLYNRMNDVFGEILQAKQESGISYLNADQMETFYLGCYNIDDFRAFFLEGPNFDRYLEPEDVIQRISESDEALLEFGMRWVKRKLFERKCAACGISGS